MKKYNIIFWIIWLALVSVGIFTISKTVVFSTVFSDYSLTLSFLQRISGVFIFTLLSIQIILGSYMDKLTGKFGSWVYKVHAFQGPAIYLLALLHPLLLLIFNFKMFHVLDPFYIYTQVCFLCKTSTELMYSFGRLAIWFLTIGFLAAVLRNSDGWLKKNWRKLHLLNYAVFFIASIHGYFLGRDFKLFPLNYVFYAFIITVFSTIVLKVARKI